MHNVFILLNLYFYHIDIFSKTDVNLQSISWEVQSGISFKLYS